MGVAAPTPSPPVESATAYWCSIHALVLVLNIWASGEVRSYRWFNG